MLSRDSYQRWAAIAAIVSAPVALASILSPLPALDYDLSAYAEPLGFLRLGEAGAAALRTSMLLDLLGYYLLIAPLVLVLEAWLRPRAGEWARLFAGCLIAYVLLGAVGASILASASPRLLRAYATASVAQRHTLEVVYGLLWDAIYGGLWNILEVLLAGVGWLGMGWLIRRDRPVIGVVTMVLGVSCLLDAIGNIFGWKTLAEAGLYVYLLLSVAWALALGVALLRRPVPPELSRAREPGRPEDSRGGGDSKALWL
jgi:hypothetical protein